MCEQDNILEALVEERICAGMSVCCSARLGSGNIYNKSLQRLAARCAGAGHLGPRRGAPCRWWRGAGRRCSYRRGPASSGGWSGSTPPGQVTGDTGDR